MYSLKMVGRIPNSTVRTSLKILKRGQSTDTYSVRDFEDIPLVKRLPLVGSMTDYTRFRGFSLERIFDLWEKRHEEYGNIFRENIGGKYTVYCRSKEDTDVMFKNEGRFPRREPAEAITAMKKSSGLSESIVNLAGEEWLKHRRVVNEPLLVNKMVWKYIESQMKVTEDLTRYILRNMDENGEVPNFISVLDRWAFEMSSVFMLDSRMGILGDSVNPEYLKMFDGFAKGVLFIAHNMKGLKVWKYVETKESKEAKSGTQSAFRIMEKIIKDREEHEDFDKTILGQMMKSEDLNMEQRKSLVFDVYGASVETTSKSSALMIYCLTLREDVQEKLREEVQALPKDEALTGRVLDRMEYMNAFIKEVVRLYPLNHSFRRIFERDIVLSGYRIPAGTPVMNTSNSTQNRNPDYFPDPDRFRPERWMGKGSIQKTLTGPFGMGARACPGRRFAMQEMRLLLVELLRNFKVEYHYKPIESVFRMTGVPSEEPRFTFKTL